jgi:hypothetical protein
MRHLTLEALARLVDEAPEPKEQEHLAACESCQDELDALQRQTEALGALPKLAPGPDAWPELRRQLRAEKLIRARRPWLAPTLRAAAALALFIAGGAAGYALRGPAPAASEPAPVAQAPAPSIPPSRPVADAATNATATPVDLGEEVERTEQMFADALDRFMRVNSTRPPDPAARLAALDNIVMTTAEALNESPADPVINSYHLTAVAQRDELLRQLAASTDEPVF